MKKLLLLFFITCNIHLQTVLYFNGNNAMNYLIDQCEIGARYPGSSGHTEAINLYYSHFNKYSDDVRLLSGYVVHPHTLDSIKLTNIFSRFSSHLKDRILLMAHFDTREYADKDINEANHSKPVIGANDGASGIAILMTLAEMLSKNPPEEE